MDADTAPAPALPAAPPPARRPWWRRLFGPRRPRVPVVRLDGVIAPPARGGRGGQGTINLRAVEGLLEAAFNRKGAKAVAIEVNSPGGYPAQCALIGRRIRALAEEKKLPVLAFTEDVAASGGYWLVCAADEIYAEPLSVVGSIGVVSASFGFQEAIARLGIERRVHTAGRNKAQLDPFRPEDPEDVARLRRLQQDVRAAFVGWVKARRGDRLKGTDEQLFEADIFLGSEALALGLIDGTDDLRTVLKRRFGPDVKIDVLRPPRPWFRIGLPFLSRRDGAAADDPRALAQAGALGLLDALEERAAWARLGL